MELESHTTIKAACTYAFNWQTTNTLQKSTTILQSPKAMLPKQPLLTHLLFLIVLLYSSSFSCQQVCNPQDQSALLAFSANISTSPPWLPLNWSFQVSCCQWEGVECDINGRVTHLQLPSRSLKGVMLVSSISNLVMLTHLNLSENYLRGSLGEDITRLTNLRVIDLSVNGIVGSIPQKIGKLLHLENLHLYENNLTGPIPPSLMRCTRIVEIILRDNRLNGDISTLDFSKLVHLQKLDLKTNSLNGTLPESIYSCKSLVAFRIAKNNITGQISPKIVELNSLSFFSVAENYLTNITVTLKLLAKCKNLTTISLSANFHGESLPVHENLINLDGFPKLQFFYLKKCSSEPGPIPNWLSTLKSLCALNLGGNRLTGLIPHWLGTLPNLFSVDLSNNNLCGEIPLKVWQLPALITENSAQANLNSSQFELPLFLPIGPKYNSIHFKANYYHGIFLSNNTLSGNIPEEIGSLQYLQMLYLDGNLFSGHISTSISNLHKLERLDLSRNNLTGEIPTSLASLNFMSYFNVSYNDLQGPIPTGGQLGSFEESDFEGNPGLCGEPLRHPCYNPPTSKASDRNESHDSKKQFLDGLFVGFASGFSSILVVIASCVWYRNSNRCRPSPRRG